MTGILKKQFMLFLMIALNASLALSETISSRDLIQQAMNHWRGVTSYSEITMTIHRADWERSMSMKTWTEGDETSHYKKTG